MDGGYPSNVFQFTVSEFVIAVIADVYNVHAT